MKIGFWLNLLSATYAACEANCVNVTSKLIGSADGGVLIFRRRQVDVYSVIQQRSRSRTCACLCLHAVCALEFRPRSPSRGFFPPTSNRAPIKHFKCQGNNEHQLPLQMGLNSESIAFSVSRLTFEMQLPFEHSGPAVTWLMWLIS